ncbi:MAG: hypothetical protein WKF57_17080 [Nakamurella sp.]
MTATAVTVPPTATAGATRIPGPVVAERTTLRRAVLGAVDG